MCTLCAMTATFDPARHTDLSADEIFQVFEDADAAAGLSTSYAISAGDSFVGALDTAGDDDWIAIELEAGEEYEIAINAFYGGGGTLSDSYLRLYSSTGSQVASNDDSGPGRDSELTFTASSSGTYYISVRAYGDSRTGSYTVETSQVLPATVATLDEMADYLTDGYWEDTGRSRRYFDTTLSNEITVNITGLTAEGQQLARWAFEAWEMVADLEFVEASASDAQIEFGDDDAGAYNYSELNFDGTIETSHVNVSTSWLSTYGTSIESYSFATYIHEIGHALGLGHQGNYNGFATYGQNETFLNDSWQMSVMSYFNQQQNTLTDASYAAVTTAMMVDIVAIQNLYGAPGSSGVTAGDTIWGPGSEIGGYLGDLLENGSSSPVAFTIYDQDGVDTLNVTGFTTNNRIDLNDESFSDVGGLIGNIGIARNTLIENASLGSGNDTVTGNEADNMIDGGNGRDTLIGGEGNDTLLGGTDVGDLSDALYAGAGNDSLDGGYGNDELRGDAGNDTIVGGFGADSVYGGTGDDVLTGQALSDLMFGGDGSDFINGGFGYDRVNGGAGADRFFHLGVADHGSDWIQDYDASQGDVLVFGDVAAGVEDFQVNFTETTNAGTAGVDEAFVIYRPTDQILWALVDGGAQDEIVLRIDGVDYDLLA